MQGWQDLGESLPVSGPPPRLAAAGGPAAVARATQAATGSADGTGLPVYGTLQIQLEVQVELSR